MEGFDYHAKYQKLAAEYSKVRAQNVVLKKAVIEEQQKTSKQNELLQSLRKAEQENDSLNFRNQQLSCRLSVLQDDLQQYETKAGKKGSTSGHKGADASKLFNSDGVDMEVLVQDLQAKITENAELHSRVSEMEQAASVERLTLEQSMEQNIRQTMTRLATLEQQNKELNKELRSALESLEQHDRSTKSKIEQLESEGLASHVTIEQQNKHIAKLKQQLMDAKISPPPLTPVHSAADSGGGDHSTAATLISPGSISSASSYVSLATFSAMQDELASPHGYSKPNQTSFHLELQSSSSTGTETPVLVSIPTLGKDLCLRFAAFIKAYCDTKQEKLKFSVADDDGKGIATVTKVQQGVLYWEKLAPLMESVLENTMSSSSGVSSPTPSGASSNGSIGTATASTLAHLRVLSTIPASPAFQSSLRSVQSSWSAILPYLSALSANSSRSHSQTTLVRLIGLLADRCAGLHTAVEEAAKKWINEEKDEADASVGTELADLVTISSQLTAALKSCLQRGIGCEAQPMDSTTKLQSSINSLQNPDQTAQVVNARKTVSGSPSSPASLSSPDDSSHLSSNYSINLSTNSIHSGNNILEASAAVLTQLHRQREHWRLEYHLLSHKYNKILKLVKEKKADATAVDFDTIAAACVTKVASTSILGEVDVSKVNTENITEGASTVLDAESTDQKGSGDSKSPSKDPSSSKQKSEELGETWRENMVRHHLISRCSKLYLELTEMSSKAAVYQDECEAAMKRLAGYEEQKLSVESEMDGLREEKARLAEELRTTCNNYEEQISAMSDHLADMNEKLAAYDDQMSMMKQKPKKGKK